MPTLIKNGKNYSGTSVSLTQAEYDALTETQKNDGTVYFITDSDAVLDASDVAVGSGTMEDVVGSIAVIETSPATSAHAVGTYLVYNGKLYKVTSAISANEQLVVGTNISATTVGNEIINRISLLWTNSNAGATFNPQTVSLSLSNYRFIMVQFRRIANQNQYVQSVCAVDGYETLCFSVPSDANISYTSCRTVHVGTSSIFFGDAYTNGTINNDRMVPYKIYGIY